MKLFLSLMSLTLLASCNPQTQYNKIIENLGYIAYRTPLDSVGVGTIIKGKPNNLMIYTRPEKCLPNTLPDGTLTNLRWVAATDLPQSVREAKFNFSADLDFFGSNGNSLFKFKTGVNYVSKVESKFTDAKIEFIDELEFWNYHKNHMSDSCKNALAAYPLFWKTLKVDKMEFIFKNEAGGNVKLTAPMVNEMLDFAADVSWTIKNEYTLTINTPKYIGFFAVQLTKESIRKEQVQVISRSLDASENYFWESVEAKRAPAVKLKLIGPKPLL